VFCWGSGARSVLEKNSIWEGESVILENATTTIKFQSENERKERHTTLISMAQGYGKLSL